MRNLSITAVLLFTASLVFGQQPIAITNSDMPNINDIFRYSITDDITGLINLDDNGPNQDWDYSTLGSFEQRLDTLVDPVFGTPLIYNVTFSNFFDMDHFATLAARNTLGQFGQGFVQVENVFDFYRETGSFFANVGMGMTINGIPMTSVMEPRDMIYEFPLEYGDQDESFAQYGFEVPQFGHYGQKIHRTNTVDAWGTVSTRYGTFDALRVTTILEITDTVSIQGFGFDQQRPTEFEVKWMVKNIGTPVITVKGQELFGSSIISSVEYLDSIRDFTMPTEPIEPPDTTGNQDTTNTTGIFQIDNLNQVNVWPNPVTSELNVGLSVTGPISIHAQLFDTRGRKVMDLGRKEFISGKHLWSHDLSGFLDSGIYRLILMDDSGGITTLPIILAK